MINWIGLKSIILCRILYQITLIDIMARLIINEIQERNTVHNHKKIIGMFICILANRSFYVSILDYTKRNWWLSTVLYDCFWCKIECF